MSPTRRDLFALMAGGAMSLAVAPAISASAPLTEREEIIAVRDMLAAIADRPDVGDRTERWADIITSMLGWHIMSLCPHDPATWHCDYIDSIDPSKASFTYPKCRASETYPHIDGQYAGR